MLFRSGEEDGEEKEKGKAAREFGIERGVKEGTPLGRVGRELAGSVWRVLWVAVSWFVWLTWRG